MPPAARRPSNTKPGLKAAAKVKVEAPKYATWDEFVSDVAGDLEPFELPLPSGEVAVIECPTGEQMDQLAEAEKQRDEGLAVAAIFGEHADAIVEATKGAPFMVRGRLIGKVMNHFGLQGENLPE